MNVKNWMLALLALVWLDSGLQGQELLPLEEAIRIGLEQNLGLKIARKSEEIAYNNASRAAAGQLPLLALNSNAAYRNQNTTIEFSSPGIEAVDVRGAGTFTLGASLDATYTVFDGFRKKYQYQRLQRNGQISAAQTSAQLQGLMLRILTGYAAVQVASSMVATSEEAVAISRERLERAKDALRFGTGSSLTVMEAEVALNQDITRLEAARQQWRSQKRVLNRTLQRDPGIDFIVEPEIPLQSSLDLLTLQEAARANNPNLIAIREQLQGARLDEKIAAAPLWPRLVANASYGYNRQDNEAGLILNQATLGPSAGLGLNFPLYDAGLRRQQVETARLARESVQFGEADLLLQVELDIQNAWDRYQLALQQLQRERENLVLAEAVLDRTRELVDLGQLGQLDFRTAQLNLQRSLDVITNYRLQVRQAELELLHLAGLLAK